MRSEKIKRVFRKLWRTIYFGVIVSLIVFFGYFIYIVVITYELSFDWWSEMVLGIFNVVILSLVFGTLLGFYFGLLYLLIPEKWSNRKVSIVRLVMILVSFIAFPNIVYWSLKDYQRVHIDIYLRANWLEFGIFVLWALTVTIYFGVVRYDQVNIWLPKFLRNEAVKQKQS